MESTGSQDRSSNNSNENTTIHSQLSRRDDDEETHCNDEDGWSLKSPSITRPSGDVRFPIRLHEMLRDVHQENSLTDVVSWNHEGDGFKVHNKSLFEERILPQYFSQSKYRSFQRQLNHYGYERILQGPFEGGYKHPDFVKVDPQKCHAMRRLKRQPVSSIQKTKVAPSPPKLSSIEADRSLVTTANPDITSRSYRGYDQTVLQSCPGFGSAMPLSPSPLPHNPLSPALSHSTSYPGIARGYFPHQSMGIARQSSPQTPSTIATAAPLLQAHRVSHVYIDPPLYSTPRPTTLGVLIRTGDLRPMLTTTPGVGRICIGSTWYNSSSPLITSRTNWHHEEAVSDPCHHDPTRPTAGAVASTVQRGMVLCDEEDRLPASSPQRPHPRSLPQQTDVVKVNDPPQKNATFNDTAAASTTPSGSGSRTNEVVVPKVPVRSSSPLLVRPPCLNKRDRSISLRSTASSSLNELSVTAFWDESAIASATTAATNHDSSSSLCATWMSLNGSNSSSRSSSVGLVTGPSNSRT